MVQDARQRTRIYLDPALGGYITAANLTKDNGTDLATFIIAFGNPDYPILKVFRGDKNVDLVFSIGEPNSTPLLDVEQAPWGYEESIPITVFTIDKTGITGTKLKWKAEAELRRILETYPFGSIRTMEKRRDFDQIFGSTILYGTEFLIKYRRDTT